MNTRTLALLAILIFAIENSFIAAIAKKGLLEIPPLSLVALRFFIASLFIAPFFFDKKRRTPAHVKEITPISLFAVINLIFFFLGVKYTSGNIAIVISSGVPLISAALLFLLFKERLPQRKIAGILIGFIGVLAIALMPLLEQRNLFSSGLVGNILLLFAATSWALYLIYSKGLHYRYSAFAITSNFIFTSTLVMLPLFLWELHSYPGWWNHVGGWGIFSVLYFAIALTLIGYTLNQYAIRHGGAVFASMTFYITPILGFYVNYLLLGEVLTFWFIIGSVLVLLGAYFVMRK
ncbi:MAG: DMT family transporter [Patescibacteria group bacterium]